MSKFNLASIFNEQTKQEAQPHGFKIDYINITKIIPSDKNEYHVDDVDELKASIEMSGLQQNLLVRSIGDDYYEIISGHRRFKAMRELCYEGNSAFTEIPCKVIQSISDIEAELELIFANSTSRQLTDYEKTYQVGRTRELLEEMKKDGHKFKGRMRDIVAGMFDVSASQIHRMDSINKNLAPELKEKFKSNEINITAAYELSKLDKDKQNHAVKEQKITVADVKKISDKQDDVKTDLEIASETSKIILRHYDEIKNIIGKDGLSAIAFALSLLGECEENKPKWYIKFKKEFLSDENLNNLKSLMDGDENDNRNQTGN